jgi:3-phenylpropionate/trans-cinnamate dioxygenase ferredoxin subunit
MSGQQPVASVSELAPGGRKSIVVDDRAVLLIRVDDDFYAVEDICSHDSNPLTDGPIVGCTIECPRHGARFDLKTGRPLCMPATEPIATFDVQVRDGQIYVRPR